MIKMIDKIISFALFFTAVFFFLYLTKFAILQQESQQLSYQNQIKVTSLIVNKSKLEIYRCYKVLDNNPFLVIRVKDNFNPKINGYSIITEDIICSFKHNNTFKTKINYSIS